MVGNKIKMSLGGEEHLGTPALSAQTFLNELFAFKIMALRPNGAEILWEDGEVWMRK